MKPKKISPLPVILFGLSFGFIAINFAVNAFPTNQNYHTLSLSTPESLRTIISVNHLNGLANNNDLSLNPIWCPKAPTLTPRNSHIAEAIGGFIYAGLGSSGSFEQYDPYTDAWILRSPGGAIAGRASAVLNGKLYAIAGVLTGTVDEYNPVSNTWSVRGSVSQRQDAAASVVNNKAYVLGGDPNTGNNGSTINQVYDPNTGTQSRQSMPRLRLNHSAATVGNKIYVFGGNTGSTEHVLVDVYDTDTNMWSTLATPMLRPRIAAAIATLNGKILLMGGSNNAEGLLSSVDEFDPVLETWTAREPLTTARNATAAAVVGGIVYVIAGQGNTGSLSSVEAYSPSGSCAPSPTVASIAPSMPIRNPNPQPLIVTGNGFQSNLTVTLTYPPPSSAITTLSGSQISNLTSTSFTLLAPLDTTGNFSIKVNNPDGGHSDPLNFTVASGPLISSISQPSPIESSTSRNITVYGSDFQTGLTVTATRPDSNTTTLSGAQIQFIDASRFAMNITLDMAGRWTIRVNNPNGGGQSSPYRFDVRAGTPTIANISPNSVISGQATMLTVTGSNFQNGFRASVITPNGTFTIGSAQRTFISSSEVHVEVTMCGTSPYNATLRITNPHGQGATGNFSVTGLSTCSGLSGDILMCDGEREWLLNGSGIISCLVSATSETGNIRLTSAKDGHYSFNDLPQGTYTISATLTYTDHITVDNNACAGDPNRLKSVTISCPNVPAPNPGQDIKFQLPLVMVHGWNSCWSKKWFNLNNENDPTYWDSYARQRGFITFTPNFQYYSGVPLETSVPWPTRANQIQDQIEADFEGLSTEFSDFQYPKWVYIAHSMGGLVGRVLANGDVGNDQAHPNRKLINDSLLGSLRKVFLIGTPNSGSFLGDEPYSDLGENTIETDFNFLYPSFGQLNQYSDIYVYAGNNGLSVGSDSDGVVDLESVYNIRQRSLRACVDNLNLTCQTTTTLFTFPPNTYFYGHTELGSPPSVDCILPDIINKIWATYTNSCPHPGNLQVTCLPQGGASSPTRPATTSSPSPYGLRTINAVKRTLNVNQTEDVTFTVGATDGIVINALASSGSATFSLINPSGQTIDFSTLPPTTGEHEVNELGEFFVLNTPSAGIWTLRAVAGASGATITVTALENSPLGLEGFAGPETITTGQTTHLSAQWTGITTGITSPSMNAQVTNEAGAVVANVMLFDDGTHGDGAAGDGVFGNDTPILSAIGRYFITFTGQGSYSGLAFTRWTQSAVDVIAPTHIFTGSFTDEAVDTNSDGAYDTIKDTVGISVGTSGSYLASADLFDSQGYFVSHGVGSTQATSAGVYSVSMDFRVSGAFCSQFASPFTIKNLTLSDAASLKTLDIYTQNPTTQTYDGSLFGCANGNPSPNIVSIQPNSLFPNQSGQITISGNNFLSGAQVSFGAGVTVSSVTYISTSALVIQIGVSPGATPGLRDVIVTNPDGRLATLTGGFTVATDQPPIVSINNVSNQQVINGIVTISATATDDIGVQRVEFYVDGTLSGTDTTFPYQFVWDTNTFTNGTHTFAAKAFDTANQNTTAQINIIVSCIMGFAPANQSFPSGGGNGSFTVTTQTSCAWTAVSNDAFITVTSGGKGSGNGTVSYTVAANTVGSSRSGTITIAGQTFTVTQAAACIYSLLPTSQTFGASGGTDTVTVTATTGCAWTAVSNDAFITVTGGAMGSGNGMVNYSVAANTGPARIGTMTIAGQTFTVMQDSGCTFMLSSTSQNFVAGGGMNSVNVTAETGCTWTAVSNNLSFITITSGASGSGNGTINYSVAANTGPARTGTMTIAGQTFTVTQDSGCLFTLDRDHQSFAANGGNGTVNITASDAACMWTASTSATFINITSGSNGTGNGTVQYTVAANGDSAIRNGTITIAGQTFTVYQGIQFNDVPVGAPFYTEIGKLSARGVTLGCGGGNYCPDQSVTREQMAAFIMRARGEFNPPTPASQRFLDVPPSNPFYNFIDRLAVLQITLGCGGNNYCPTNPVLREQMAAFLIRALHEPGYLPPAPGSQRFDDVQPSNPFYGHIEEMAVRGITLGCSANPPLYCPTQSVTRAQMAAFLVRAFDL